MTQLTYAVFGVLQEVQHTAGTSEWIHVNDVVTFEDQKIADGNQDLALHLAAEKAFARAQQRPSGRPYPTLPAYNDDDYTHEVLEKLGWNYWTIGIVEVSPGMPVVFAENLDDGSRPAGPRERIQSWLELADVEGRLEEDPNRDRLWTIAGQRDGGDGFIQQFMSGPNPEDAFADVWNWADYYGYELEGVYGYLRQEDLSGRPPGHPTPLVPPQGPGPFRFTLFDGDYTKLYEAGPAGPAGSALDPADLATVNKHRRVLGMPPIDMAHGWTAKEIAEMAESIRTTGKTFNNPRRAELKRRLMR